MIPVIPMILHHCALSSLPEIPLCIALLNHLMPDGVLLPMDLKYVKKNADMIVFLLKSIFLFVYPHKNFKNFLGLSKTTVCSCWSVLRPNIMPDKRFLCFGTVSELPLWVGSVTSVDKELC